MSKPQSDSFSLQVIFRESAFSGKVVIAVATWFGTGLLPFAPGTFGTLATVPLVLVFYHLGIFYKALSLVIVTVLAFWSSGRYQDLLGKSDPPEVVIDEVAGFLLTMLFLPFSWLTLALGFAFFRLFDILKPYPVRQLENRRGGFGIVMDDLVAGIYAHLCVRIVLSFLG